MTLRQDPVPFREAGGYAFARGELRLVPRAILVYSGADAARAWYAGWDAANLAAPVPDVTDVTDYEAGRRLTRERLAVKLDAIFEETT